MEQELGRIWDNLRKSNQVSRIESVSLFPGVVLSYLTFTAASASIKHQPLDYVMEINYCKAGRIDWQIENGNHIYLTPGNYAVHTMKACADSKISFPTGVYEGLTLHVDFQEVSAYPPEILDDATSLGKQLKDSLCGESFTSFAGTMKTELIFSAFYDQPEPLKLPYQKIKALELLLYLAKSGAAPGERLTEYQSEQIEIVRKIHQRLIAHMDEKSTIEELSREYLINPTTLKETFKAVYGMSLAAHIKQHRMSRAAELLQNSDLSIAEIAQTVGYNSQSRFTSAFKSSFQVLPKEFRKLAHTKRSHTIKE